MAVVYECLFSVMRPSKKYIADRAACVSTYLLKHEMVVVAMSFFTGVLNPSSVAILQYLPLCRCIGSITFWRIMGIVLGVYCCVSRNVQYSLGLVCLRINFWTIMLSCFLMAKTEMYLRGRSHSFICAWFCWGIRRCLWQLSGHIWQIIIIVCKLEHSMQPVLIPFTRSY